MGDQVAIAVIGELAIVVDWPEHFERGVVGGWKAREQRLFFLPPFLNRLPVRAVYPSVGRF